MPVAAYVVIHLVTAVHGTAIKACRALAFPLDSKSGIVWEAAGVTPAVPIARLQGLERVYFEHVGVPGGPISIPARVSRFLAEAIPANSHANRSTFTDGGHTQISIHDFSLPLRDIKRGLFVRQIVIIEETARIRELWWALYDHGNRSDVWYFKADPERNDSKALSNYEIDTVLLSTDGRLDFKILGEMFRPQGAWWLVGKDFVFLLDDDNLMLDTVLNVFGFFRDYDLGAVPPELSVSVEREVEGHFETRVHDAVPRSVLRACRFRDPTSEMVFEFNWRRLEKVALCITGSVGTKPHTRGLNEPSFVERGGAGM